MRMTRILYRQVSSTVLCFIFINIFLVSETKKEPVMRKSCTLSVPIQTLINEIFDLKMIEASIKSVGYDQKKIPLGRLEDVTVKAAYTVLKEV